MIRTENAHLNIDTATHPGMTGKKNEDRFGVTPYMVDEENRVPSVLAVLCDGIGGHRAGEVAAEMGVSLITEIVTNSKANHPLRTLEEAITHASQAIYQASLSDMGRQGMGATCAVAWVVNDRLYTVNMGDSRIYLVRDGHIIQLTTDHTWVQEALDSGLLADTDLNTHPNAHVIRRYLGSKKAPKPDFRLWFFEGEQDQDALENQGLRLMTGDVLLLCSDGLTDLVSDEEILAVIQDELPKDIPNILVEMANQRGGHDNTTVVVLTMPVNAPGKVASTKKQRRLVRLLVLLVFIGAAAVAAIFGLHRWGLILPEGDFISPTPTETLATGLPLVFSTETNTPGFEVSPTMTPEPLGVMDGPEATITAWPTNTHTP